MVDKEKEKVNKELKLALTEIGKIEPWFDPGFNCWIFSHPLYPVECEGTTASTVIKKYPKYLKTFIEHRIKDKLDPINEKKTKGKGGYRPELVAQKVVLKSRQNKDECRPILQNGLI